MKRRGSNIWAGIKATWEKFYSGLEASTDGSNVRRKHDRSGVFSVRPAYETLPSPEVKSDAGWLKIWKLPVLQRCRRFLWLASRKSHLTNAARHRRGLSENAVCPTCGSEVEDNMHALRDCRFTKLLWRQIVPPSRWRRLCTMELMEWGCGGMSPIKGLMLTIGVQLLQWYVGGFGKDETFSSLRGRQ